MFCFLWFPGPGRSHRLEPMVWRHRQGLPSREPVWKYARPAPVLCLAHLHSGFKNVRKAKALTQPCLDVVHPSGDGPDHGCGHVAIRANVFAQICPGHHLRLGGGSKTTGQKPKTVPSHHLCRAMLIKPAGCLKGFNHQRHCVQNDAWACLDIGVP